MKECIDCVLNQTYQFSKIVVINNNSSDGTKEYLREHTNSDVRFIIRNLTENIGGAGGFSYGLSVIRSENVDWTLIIDDDAMIASDYIDKIRSEIEKHDNVAFSGTITMDNFIDVAHRKFIVNDRLMNFKSVQIENYKKNIFEYELSSFCGLVIKKEIIKLIGLPIEDYFIWYDDTEYSLRINRISKIINVNSAILNHKVKICSNKDIVTWKSYYGYRNFIDIGRKYSKSKVLFLTFIYTKHIMQIFRSIGYLIISSKKEMWKYKLGVHIDVIKDSLRHISGKKTKYLP